MASRDIVLNLYAGIIDDVIGKLKVELTEDGTDDDIIDQLKEKWLEKTTTNKAVKPMNTSPEAANQVGNQQPSTSRQRIEKLPIVNIKLPSPNGMGPVLQIMVPHPIIQGNYLPTILTASIITTALRMPLHIAEDFVQKQVYLFNERLVKSQK